MNHPTIFGTNFGETRIREVLSGSENGEYQSNDGYLFANSDADQWSDSHTNGYVTADEGTVRSNADGMKSPSHSSSASFVSDSFIEDTEDYATSGPGASTSLPTTAKNVQVEVLKASHPLSEKERRWSIIETIHQTAVKRNLERCAAGTLKPRTRLATIPPCRNISASRRTARNLFILDFQGDAIVLRSSKQPTSRLSTVVSNESSVDSGDIGAASTLVNIFPERSRALSALAPEFVPTQGRPRPSVPVSRQSNGLAGRISKITKTVSRAYPPTGFLCTAKRTAPSTTQQQA